MKMKCFKKGDNSISREIRPSESIGESIENSDIIIKLNDGTEWVSIKSLEDTKAWRELGTKDHNIEQFKKLKPKTNASKK